MDTWAPSLFQRFVLVDTEFSLRTRKILDVCTYFLLRAEIVASASEDKEAVALGQPSCSDPVWSAQAQKGRITRIPAEVLGAKGITVETGCICFLLCRHLISVKFWSLWPTNQGNESNLRGSRASVIPAHRIDTYTGKVESLPASPLSHLLYYPLGHITRPQEDIWASGR